LRQRQLSRAGGVVDPPSLATSYPLRSADGGATDRAGVPEGRWASRTRAAGSTR
jgi:hypothetical protein